MSNRIRLKRSATPGSIPTVLDLDLGELAINTDDGIIFFKRDNGVETIHNVLSDLNISDDNTFAERSSTQVASEKAAGEGIALNSSTGIIYGGLISTGHGTTFDVDAGYGVISNTASGNRESKFVSWSAFTGITPTHLSDANVTYLAINADAELVQQTSRYSPAQRRSLIILGVVVHTNRTNINVVNNQQHVVIHPVSQIHDMAFSFGLINVNGNVFSANGANLMLNKSAGSIFGAGLNYENDANNPNIKTTNALTSLTFQYRFQNGTSTGDLTQVNPSIYELNGVSTVVPTGKYTIQRLYLFPSNITRIQPGQNLYSSIANATANIQLESFNIEENIYENATLRGFLVLKWDASDLTDPNQAFFLEAGKFNSTAGIGGLSVSSLQDAYNNSVQPTIVTSTEIGPISIKRGSASDADRVFEILDGDDNTVLYVNGDGTSSLDAVFDTKVDKVSGYGLSKHDLTDSIYDDLTTQNYIRNEMLSAVQITGGIITPTGGIGFQISAGVGYARDLTGKYVRVTWNTLTGLTTTNNGDNFINIDYTGNLVITSSAEQGDLIALGYISTALSNTVIVGYSNARLTGSNHLFNIGEWLRSTVGSLVQVGCNTAMQLSPNELKITVSSGFIWTLLNRLTINDTSTFTKLVKSSDFGFFVDSLTTANTVNTAYWNNTSNPAASALVPLTTGYWKKDLIALTPEGSVFYIYGSSEWATLDEAKLAPVPLVPDNIKLAIVRSAALVSQQGATSVDTVLDIRPMISRLFDTGQAASNASIISHSNLIDLGNDDHTQYHTDARGDARYYRKSEVDTLLSGKSSLVHSHAVGDITGLVPGSVGLGSVQNVDQTNASNLTSGTVNNNRLTANLKDLGGISFTTNDLIQYNGGNLVNINLSSLKTQLQLNNVLNEVQVINAGDGVSFATGPLSSRPTASLMGRLYATTDNGIYIDNGSNWVLQQAPISGDISISAGGTTATLATVNSNIGTFNNVTVNGKGLVTSASNVSYLTGNQTITVTGDATGSGTTGIALTLATVNSNTGSFGSSSVVPVITVNGKGLVTAVSSANITPSSIGLGNVVNSLQVINAGTAVSLASGTNASKPAAGTNGRFYASTDQGLIYFDNGSAWTAQVPAYTGDVTSTLGGTALTLATVNSNVGTFNNVTVNGKGLVTAASNVAYLTGNQTITVTGDVSGSGTTGITATLATVNSNTGSFGSSSVVPVITVNGKGLITAVSTANITASSIGLGNVVNSLQVINAGNGVSFASGTLASRPAAGTNGRLYASTDQGIYLDNGTTWVLQDPAYTGDVTKTAGATALTLATVNSNVGTFNNITINAKGLATAGSNANYLVDPAANGILARTSLNTTAARTITNVTNQTAVTNGDGSGGNPTIGLADNAVMPGTASMTIPIGTTAQRSAPTNGQIRYNTDLTRAEISDSNVWRPFGKVVQVLTGDITQTSGTTQIPYDATIPLSTEGFQIWSQAITPLYTTSIIIVIFNVFCENSAAGVITSMVLYNGTTAIAAAAATVTGLTANLPTSIGITKQFTAGTTSTITLSARIGPASAATVYVNRGNTETFSGTPNTSYIIMEIV